MLALGKIKALVGGVFLISATLWGAEQKEEKSYQAHQVDVSVKRQIADTGPSRTVRSISGNYRVVYHNESIMGWGTKVFLVYGFQKFDVNFSGKDVDWYIKNIDGIELESIDKWTWATKTDIFQVVHYSGGPTTLGNFQFVFKIVNADGSVLWDRGGNGMMGFYQTSDILLTSPTHEYENCLAQGKDENGYCAFVVKTVDRD